MASRSTHCSAVSSTSISKASQPCRPKPWRCAGESSGVACASARHAVLPHAWLAALSFERPDAPRRFAPPRTGGVRPSWPVVRAPFEMPRDDLRASAREPLLGTAVARAASGDVPHDSRSGRCASSQASRLHLEAEASRPRGAPLTGRSRSPASSIVRHAFPRARDGSPRGRIRPPASMLPFRRACPCVRVRALLFRASDSPFCRGHAAQSAALRDPPGVALTRNLVPVLPYDCRVWLADAHSECSG